MYVETNVEIPVNLNSKQKSILKEFEKEGEHQNIAQNRRVFFKIKRSLGRFNLISFQLTYTKV